MNYSIVQKSQLEGKVRLDAEYYQPEYLEVDLKIKSLEPKSLKDLVDKVFSGPFGSTLKSESYQKKGVPFIRIGNITDIFIDKNNLVYISPEEHRRIHNTYLKPGDIVFSKIGTVGRLSVISDELGEVNISENNIGIRLSELSDEMRSFLLFFLLSKYGQLQIMRKSSGNVQPKLNVVDINSLKVPTATNNFASELFGIYEKLKESRRDSETSYSQAQELLLEELELSDFEPEDELSWTVDFSEVTDARRMDVEYFQPKYSRLINMLKNKTPLKEVAIRKVDKIELDSEKEYDYIEIGNVDVGSGEVSFDVPLKMKDLPASARIDIDGGELLISKVRPTRGAVTIVPEDKDRNYVATSAFSVFETESPMKEYLQVLLRSVVGKVQLERPTTGTSYPTITDTDVENLYIPILSKSVQEKIAEKVRQSHEARKKAKELLEQAKQKVEELIEQDK